MIDFRVHHEALSRRAARLARRLSWLRAAQAALAAVVVDGAVRVAALPAPPRPWLAAAAVAIVAFILVREGRERGAGLEARLDRRFGLNELLTTAVEVDHRGARTDPERRLLRDAAAAAASLASRGRLAGRSGRIEAELAASLALLAVGLQLMAIATGATPSALPLAPLEPLGVRDLARGDATGSEDGLGFGSRSAGAAMTLAGALADHGAARALAAALAAGRAAEAARAARELADRAGELSPAGRRDLADALRAAAGALGPADAGLAGDLRQVAIALEADPQAAADALDRLGSSLGAMPDAVSGARPPLALGRRRPRSTVAPLALDGPSSGALGRSLPQGSGRLPAAPAGLPAPAPAAAQEPSFMLRLPEATVIPEPNLPTWEERAVRLRLAGPGGGAP